MKSTESKKWVIDQEECHVNKHGVEVFVISSEDLTVKEIADVYDSKENALLISKSPEMLEMLRNQLEFLIYCRDNMKVSRPVFNQKIVRLEKLIKEATELK